MMTFQELTDTIGAENIYNGTQVDVATQGALLEWLFDRKLSVEGYDTNKWLRIFRRRLNMNYPIYKDYLRVESVRSNMDPFITDFMERIHEETYESKTADTNSKTGSVSKSGSDRTVTDNQTVRTPDLTTAGTTGNTRTDNTQTAVTGSDTGTIRTDINADETDNGQRRSMNIAYPEANMGSIPTGISGFPTNIDYAEGEADEFSQNHHEADNDTTETRNLSNSSTTNNTGTVTDAGTNSVRETGTDTTDFDGDVTRTTTGLDQTTETGTGSRNINDKRDDKDTEQGRHESPADLLPRAISAITGTNAIKWFVNSLMLCFDNYDFL